MARKINKFIQFGDMGLVIPDDVDSFNPTTLLETALDATKPEKERRAAGHRRSQRPG